MPTKSLKSLKRKTDVLPDAQTKPLQMHNALSFVLIEKLFHSKKPNKHVYRSSVDVYWFLDDEFLTSFFLFK